MSMVTLHDGRQVRTDSYEWRHECEARAIAQLPSRAARSDWLAKIETKRGQEAAERLRRTLTSMWAARKGNS